MVDGCYEVNKSYTFNEIVNVFKCIGQRAETSKDAQETTVTFGEVLATQFGIDSEQASLFAARILDYRPKAGATPAQIHQDLVAEMKQVVIDPQSRFIENNTAPTEISAIDKLRMYGSGYHVQIPLSETATSSALIFFGGDVVPASGGSVVKAPAWERNSVGSTVTLIQLPQWQKDEISAYRRIIEFAKENSGLKSDTIRRILENARGSGAISESEYLRYMSDK